MPTKAFSSRLTTGADSSFPGFGNPSATQKSNSRSGIPRTSPTSCCATGRKIDCILSEGDADFIISGHTHGGQIRLPFNLLWFEASPDHTQPYTYPWHISAGNKYLITKGLGTSTLPLRFNCPPEIYLLTLH